MTKSKKGVVSKAEAKADNLVDSIANKVDEAVDKIAERFLNHVKNKLSDVDKESKLGKIISKTSSKLDEIKKMGEESDDDGWFEY